MNPKTLTSLLNSPCPKFPSPFSYPPQSPSSSLSHHEARVRDGSAVESLQRFAKKKFLHERLHHRTGRKQHDLRQVLADSWLCGLTRVVEGEGDHIGEVIREELETDSLLKSRCWRFLKWWYLSYPLWFSKLLNLGEFGRVYGATAGFLNWGEAWLLLTIGEAAKLVEWLLSEMAAAFPCSDMVDLILLT
ncbi:hypothetical protein Droror1_Dr00006676 [Drosera rotundifolia]